VLHRNRPSLHLVLRDPQARQRIVALKSRRDVAEAFGADAVAADVKDCQDLVVLQNLHELEHALGSNAVSVQSFVAAEVEAGEGFVAGEGFEELRGTLGGELVRGDVEVDKTGGVAQCAGEFGNSKVPERVFPHVEGTELARALDQRLEHPGGVEAEAELRVSLRQMQVPRAGRPCDRRSSVGNSRRNETPGSGSIAVSGPGIWRRKAPRPVQPSAPPSSPRRSD
jgi:hypothetical protein